MNKSDFDWTDFDGQEILHEGEEILWQGAPKARLETHRRHLRNGAVWSIIAICIIVIAISLEQGGNVKTQMLVAASALFGVAIYASVGQMFLRRAQLKRTRYAITNKRVLSLETKANGKKIHHDIVIDQTTTAALSAAEPDTLSFWLADENPGDKYDGRGLQFVQLENANQVLDVFRQAIDDND